MLLHPLSTKYIGIMSKYTRLNKINHYHDSGSTKNHLLITKTKSGLNSSQTKPPPSSMFSNMLSKRSSLSLSSSSTPFEQHPSHHHRYYNNSNININKLAFLAFISLMLVFLICINEAHSLNCYHCSSIDNPDCDEAFTGKANITDTDCEKQIGRPAKVCRKIVQYIEQKKVVIRSCGFIDDHDEKDRKPMCYKRSGTFAIMMESCNCYTDNCNHSASLVPRRSVLIFASCFVSLYYITTYHLLGFNSERTNLGHQ